MFDFFIYLFCETLCDFVLKNCYTIFKELIKELMVIYFILWLCKLLLASWIQEEEKNPKKLTVENDST